MIEFKYIYLKMFSFFYKIYNFFKLKIMNCGVFERSLYNLSGN